MIKVKVGMVSLGCAKNQVDAEMMLGRLQDGGYELVSDLSTADVAVVNTCGFIADAKREAIEEILDLARLKKEGNLRKILVTGCLAERYKKDIMREMPEVDGVLGLGANGDIVEAVNKLVDNQSVQEFPDIRQMPLRGRRVQSTPKHYAYLRVADGCDNRCAYCAIPMIRGPFRSRPMEELLREASALADDGVKELLVIAQDTTRYGEDLYGKLTLPELLRNLARIDGIRWIRLLYCYPDRVTDELIEVMATEDKIVKYIDLPLQHCNDRLLRTMNRRASKAEIVALVKKMRSRIPGLAIRTTLIAGLPGEGDAEFDELAHFVRDMRFERLGCFAYSSEEGTRAAEMPGQVEEKERRRRQEIIMAEQEQVSAALLAGLVGSHCTVLAEGYDPDRQSFYGRSQAEAPEIDGRIYFSVPAGESVAAGEWIRVHITESDEHDLFGVMVTEEAKTGTQGE